MLGDWMNALDGDDMPITMVMAGCVRGHREPARVCECCGHEEPGNYICEEWDEAKRKAAAERWYFLTSG